jgi:hypothetical protein
MRALRRFHDDPSDLMKRIAERKAARKGCRDLEQRLVVAQCRRIRREMKQERQSHA